VGENKQKKLLQKEIAVRKEQIEGVWLGWRKGTGRRSKKILKEKKKSESEKRKGTIEYTGIS